MCKLKIGVVGASRGMDYAARSLYHYDYAEIYAICESYPLLCEKAKNVLAEQGRSVLAFQDYEEFLSCGIDAVILCNYANKHAEYAIRALDRGIHVLSEVLPCETMSEAVRLCEAVEKSGCVYAYGENYCYGDGMYEMMQVYESGIIGEAVHLEGDFINDCSHKWHLLTRGNRDHWRNYVPSTFYCTHSIGPMLYATGLRGIRVNGFEIPRMDYMAEVGARSGSGAMEVLELNNRGIAKSMNGNYRHTYTARYRLIGEKGFITANWRDVHICIDKGSYQYDQREYRASPHDFAYRPTGFGEADQNSDKMVVGYFVGAILGDAECRKRSIDVYRALDMSMPGLLAYRSIVDGGKPYDIPDMRDSAAREAYRHDHYSTSPDAPEAYRLPTSKLGTPVVEETVYDHVKETFRSVELTPGMK